MVLLTQEGGTFAAHSNHPRIGTTHSPDLTGLRHTIDALVDTLPDDVQVSYATSVPDALREGEPDPAKALAADEPEHAYETVPGTERLPAATDEERRASETTDDAKPTERFRRDPGVDVVGLGHVAPFPSRD